MIPHKTECWQYVTYGVYRALAAPVISHAVPISLDGKNSGCHQRMMVSVVNICSSSHYTFHCQYFNNFCKWWDSEEVSVSVCTCHFFHSYYIHMFVINFSRIHSLHTIHNIPASPPTLTEQSSNSKFSAALFHPLSSMWRIRQHSDNNIPQL